MGSYDKEKNTFERKQYYKEKASKVSRNMDTAGKIVGGIAGVLFGGAAIIGGILKALVDNEK